MARGDIAIYREKRAGKKGIIEYNTERTVTTLNLN
jgi:hypothetical protein